MMMVMMMMIMMLRHRSVYECKKESKVLTSSNMHCLVNKKKLKCGRYTVSKFFSVVLYRQDFSPAQPYVRRATSCPLPGVNAARP